jgi:MFS family permease
VTETLANEQPSPLKRKRELFAALSGVALTVSIVAFDATIISTILPQVAQALDGLSLYAWAGTGYFLACSVTILIFGRLGDLYGRKRLMLLSLVLVGLGSALSGLSQSMGQLIAFRVLQGLGGGMMIATAFAAPADLFPDPKERIRWMVMLSATFAAASGIGPVLGGAVTQALGWRAAFFVIPVTALIALSMIWRFFPHMVPLNKGPRNLDWVGSILLAWSVGAPLVGLELLTMDADRFPTWAALAIIFSALPVVAILIMVERRVLTPMFPLRILETPQARYLNLAAILSGAIMFVLIYYIPLQFQDQFGFSPTRAGILLSPLVAGIPIGSIINGRLFPRESNPQRLMVLGSLLLFIGCGLTLTFTKESSMTMVLVTMGICGLGLGFLLPNFTLFIQIIARREDVGLASALVQTTRAMGSAIGTALVGILIAELSIQTGLRIGLFGAVICSFIIGLLVARVKMNSYTT